MLILFMQAMFISMTWEIKLLDTPSFMDVGVN